MNVQEPKTTWQKRAAKEGSRKPSILVSYNQQNEMKYRKHCKRHSFSSLSELSKRALHIHTCLGACFDELFVVSVFGLFYFLTHLHGDHFPTVKTASLRGELVALSLGSGQSVRVVLVVCLAGGSVWSCGCCCLNEPPFPKWL